MSGTFNPPANPTDGQLYTFGGSTWRWQASPAPGAWVNASTGANFVPLTGGTMTGPLVLSGNAPASAPLQAVPQQQVATAIAAAPDNVGRNLLHNGLLNVQQRGAGPFNTTGYTADRWMMDFNSDTLSVTLPAVSDSFRSQIGDEAATHSLQANVTGSAAATAYSVIFQRIEGVQRLGGKTVTVSFFASASVANFGVGVGANQNFGTGGSPSATVSIAATRVTTTTTFARYSVTLALPTTIGKVLGTAGNDYTSLFLWLSSGANNSANAGVGVQSGGITFWGLQLELGSVATPLEKLDPRIDLANCQRFYFADTVHLDWYGAAANAFMSTRGTYPVTMRAPPTIAFAGQSYTNASGWGASNITAGSCEFALASTASGASAAYSQFTASADL